MSFCLVYYHTMHDYVVLTHIVPTAFCQSRKINGESNFRHFFSVRIQTEFNLLILMPNLHRRRDKKFCWAGRSEFVIRVPVVNRHKTAKRNVAALFTHKSVPVKN